MSTENTPNDWWSAGQLWLIKRANAHFHKWAESPAGARWRKKPNKSPHHLGYSQPVWMDEAREALGCNDEERFKRIKLDNLSSDEGETT
jgi:hypothetical protein